MSHLIPYAESATGTNFSIPNTGTETAVTWDSVAQQWAGTPILTPTDSKFIAPEPGIYQFTCMATWAALGTATWAMTTIWQAGTNRIAASINQPNGATWTTIRQTCSMLSFISTGDYVEMRCAQNAAAAGVNITTRYARLALLGRHTALAA